MDETSNLLGAHRYDIADDIGNIRGLAHQWTTLASIHQSARPQSTFLFFLRSHPSPKTGHAVVQAAWSWVERSFPAREKAQSHMHDS